jgi:membrane protein
VLTDTVSELGPQTAAKTFQGPITSITAHRGAAGALVVAGGVAALWAASGYVRAFTDACNAVYEVEEGRPFWKRKPLQLLITLLIIIMATAVALGLIFTGQLVSARGISGAVLTLWRYAKWPAMVLLMFFTLAVLYYATPNARPSGIR